MNIIVNLGLLLILCAVLFLPFIVKRIEDNLEIFLFVCGVAALTIAGFASTPGATTGWSWAIIIEALTSPLDIARVDGVPVGIVQVVLLVGLLIYYFHHELEKAINHLIDRVSLTVIL